MQEQNKTSLPENAYRELKAGEKYEPVMPTASSPKEITPYSVGMGLLMAVIFSAAAAYLGLKVGQVFEAAIPIAIIAVGVGSVKNDQENCSYPRNSTSPKIAKRGTAVSVANRQTVHNIALSFAKRFFIFIVAIIKIFLRVLSLFYLSC